MPGVLPQTKTSQFNSLFLSLHLFNLLPRKKEKKIKRKIKNSHSDGSLQVQVNLLQVPINIGLEGLIYLSINSNEACPEAKGEPALKLLVKDIVE